MLPVYLLWTDATKVLRCSVFSVCIVVGEVSIGSGCVEVVHNVATDARVVVVRHWRHDLWRAVGD